jgi:hypothetical protein
MSNSVLIHALSFQLHSTLNTSRFLQIYQNCPLMYVAQDTLRNKPKSNSGFLYEVYKSRSVPADRRPQTPPHKVLYAKPDVYTGGGGGGFNGPRCYLGHLRFR